MIDQITAAGGDIKFAWMPALKPNSLYPGSPGPIFGNSHMIMFDNNNLDVADILIGWVDAHVKKPTNGNGNGKGNGNGNGNGNGGQH